MAMPCSSSKPPSRIAPTSPVIRDLPPPATNPVAPRPRVLLNLALTADGKIATADRSIVTFGSLRDRQHMFELRATVDAVMCGARTLAESLATLDAGPARFRALRRRRGLTEQPVRVIVSGSASISTQAPLWRHRAGPVVLLATAKAPAARLRKLSRLGAVPGIFGRESLDAHASLAWLREKWGIRRLLCEGGGQLNATLFRAGLVDEVHLTLCPIIFGGATAPSLVDGSWPSALSEAITLQLYSHRQHGKEVFLVYHLTQPG